MRSLSVILFFICCIDATAQKADYTDSIRKFQETYIKTHEVVKDGDRKYLRFFPVDKKYRVTATFKKTADSNGFSMKTSGSKIKQYFRYGVLSFRINNKACNLTVYQSRELWNHEQYKDYLFVPYTDLTTGEESYGGGKYLDFVISDIRNNTLIIDFNKAYNPYCAYTSGYNCPIPPRENNLPVAIRAGEMNYGKSH